MVSYMCKKNCLWCHFFSVYGDHSTLGRWKVSVTQKERLQILEEENFYRLQNLKVDYRTYLCCSKGAWDEQILIKNINRYGEDKFHQEQKDELKKILWETIIDINRNAKNSCSNSCFYHKFQPGMLLPAAEELEKRETMQKEAAADRKWIKRGIWIPAFATLVASILGVVLTYNFSIRTNDATKLNTNHAKNKVVTAMVAAKNSKLLDRKK